MAALLRLAFLLLVLLPCTLCGFCDDDSFDMVFRDEFDGASLNTSAWTAVVAPAQPATMHCNGTGCIRLGACRDASCVASNAYLHEGKLVLRSQALGEASWTTGAVSTWGKASWKPSDGTFRVCVSARLPGAGIGRSQGLWPAHWLMPMDGTCDPDEGEMDILEMVNGNGLYEATYHWQTTFPKSNCSYPTGHYQQHTAAPLPSWDSAQNEFAVERGLDHVAFVLNGRVMINITRNTTPAPVFWDVPFYLILNTAVGGGWPGKPNASTLFPALHEIGYVRVAQRSVSSQSAESRVVNHADR